MENKQTRFHFFFNCTRRYLGRGQCLLKTSFGELEKTTRSVKYVPPTNILKMSEKKIITDGTEELLFSFFSPSMEVTGSRGLG